MLSLSNDPYARTVSAGMSERRARTRAGLMRLCRALQAALARLRPGREDCLAWERGQAGDGRITPDQSEMEQLKTIFNLLSNWHTEHRSTPCAEKVLCFRTLCESDDFRFIYTSIKV